MIKDWQDEREQTIAVAKELLHHEMALLACYHSTFEKMINTIHLVSIYYRIA